MTCISCSRTAERNHDFCPDCGWPLKQPSPYGGKDKSLPVVEILEAASRDPLGRALAYDAAPRSGRAFIPGEHAGKIDKLPDFPSTQGRGNRRSGEVRAGLRSPTGEMAPIQGTHIVSNHPIDVGFGAGRVVWVDDHEIFTWDLFSEFPARLDLAGLRPLSGQSLVASGWRTYLRTAQGLQYHDGLANVIATISPDPVDAITAWGTGIAAAKGTSLEFISRDGNVSTSEAPFAIHALASEGEQVAAFGKSGEIAIPDAGGKWVTVASPLPDAILEQCWIVNGRAGVRIRARTQEYVVYAPASTEASSSEPISIVTDTPICVIPGKEVWSDHRILGFQGGGEPKIRIYGPAETNVLLGETSVDTPAAGACLAVVRRDVDGTGAITLAYLTVGGALAFVRLRSGQYHLPSTFQLIAGVSRAYLIPYVEGMLVLASDGRAVTVNKILYP